MAISVDPYASAAAAFSRVGRNRPYPTIPGADGGYQMQRSGPGQVMPPGVLPPMPVTPTTPAAPPGITTQNGQQGIMGRGGNFQALGAAAQRRLAAGGSLGQLQGGPGQATRPGTRPMGPPPGMAGQPPSIAQTKPLALPQGLEGEGAGGGWGSAGGFPMPRPGNPPNFSDFVGMVGNGTLGGGWAGMAQRLGPGGAVGGGGVGGIGGPGGPGAPAGPGGPNNPLVDPAQGPGAATPTPDIVNPGDGGVLQRDAQPPMLPPMIPPGLRGGMVSGRGAYQPDARAGYANLMNRFAY